LGVHAGHHSACMQHGEPKEKQMKKQLNH